MTGACASHPPADQGHLGLFAGAVTLSPNATLDGIREILEDGRPRRTGEVVRVLNAWRQSLGESWLTRRAILNYLYRLERDREVRGTYRGFGNRLGTAILWERV